MNFRTINACISQLRFFTLYVLHKPWDPYQLPFRKFDSYTPFIPSREEMKTFLFSISDIKFKAISLPYVFFRAAGGRGTSSEML